MHAGASQCARSSSLVGRLGGQLLTRSRRSPLLSGAAGPLLASVAQAPAGRRHGPSRQVARARAMQVPAGRGHSQRVTCTPARPWPRAACRGAWQPGSLALYLPTGREHSKEGNLETPARTPHRALRRRAMLVSLVSLWLCSWAAVGSSPIAQTFDTFTVAFARNYSGAERERRFAIFEQNFAMIEVPCSDRP